MASSLPTDLELARMAADFVELEHALRLAGYQILDMIHDEMTIQRIKDTTADEVAVLNAWNKFALGRVSPLPIIPVSSDSVLFMDWTYDKKGTP